MPSAAVTIEVPSNDQGEAMSEQKESAFKKRWIGKVEERIAYLKTKPFPTAEEYSKLLREHIRGETQSVAQSALKKMVGSKFDSEVIGRVIDEQMTARAKDQDAPNTQRPEVLGIYRRMKKQADSLLDVRTQEKWSDTHDLMKGLLFRMLTALGIAAVILGTAWLAHSLGIPLPMIRPT